jgi:hypothetical protein
MVVRGHHRYLETQYGTAPEHQVLSKLDMLMEDFTLADHGMAGSCAVSEAWPGLAITMVVAQQLRAAPHSAQGSRGLTVSFLLFPSISTLPPVGGGLVGYSATQGFSLSSLLKSLFKVLERCRLF